MQQEIITKQISALNEQLIAILVELKKLSQTHNKIENTTKIATLHTLTEKCQQAVAAYPHEEYAPQHLTHFAHLAKYLSRTREDKTASWQAACNEFMKMLTQSLYRQPFFKSEDWLELMAACQNIDYPNADGADGADDNSSDDTAYKQARKLVEATQALADHFNLESEEIMHTLRQKAATGLDPQEYAQGLKHSITALALIAATFTTADLAMAWRNITH